MTAAISVVTVTMAMLVMVAAFADVRYYFHALITANAVLLVVCTFIWFRIGRETKDAKEAHHSE